MENKIVAPVLLIAFNRPDTTEKVFDCIRKAAPTKLYVALDGYREEKTGEKELCGKVKLITGQVNWNCEVNYKINETNFGAEVTISEAIKWVFKTEEYSLILEDDTIAPLSFFFGSGNA